MGKIRSEPLRWPDRDSRVLALHELMPNLNAIFFYNFTVVVFFIVLRQCRLRAARFEDIILIILSYALEAATSDLLQRK